jgi:hypothetical protein
LTTVLPRKNLIALPPRPEHNWYLLWKVSSAAVSGIDAHPIEVEVNVGHIRVANAACKDGNRVCCSIAFAEQPAD